MAWLIGNLGQVRSAIARMNSQRGYPRNALLSERVGGGIHVPLEQAVTVRHAFVARLSDLSRAMRIDLADVPELTPAQQLLVVADLPGGVTVTQEDED